MKRTAFGLIFSVCALLIISGCGVNKKGKLRTGSRVFENTTARYNALYNANNLLSEYELGKQANIADDYDQFLPVFYTIPQDSTNKALAEKVEKKMAAIVTKHEASKWTDDSYLDLGIAQFYSGKFDDAENTFKYIIQQFDPVALELQTYYPKENSKQAEKARAEAKKKEDKKAREEAVKQRKEEKKQREKDREKAKEDRKKKVTKKEPKPEKNKATADDVKRINEKRAKNDDPAPVRKGKMTEKERQEAIKARKQAIKDREKEKRKNESDTEPQYAENKNREEQEKKEASTVDKIDEVIATQEVTEDIAVATLDDTDVVETKSDFESSYYFQRPNALNKNGHIIEAYEVDSKTTDFHIPAFYESILWLARTKTIDKDYYAADIYLRQLFTLRNVPDYVIDDAYLAVADNYIQRGNYITAVVAIDEALKAGAIDNFEKARLAYLQGQLYEFLKEPLKAKDSYNKVSSFHPSYEHLIRSDLNVLRIDAVESGNADAALKTLTKMSKEDKNAAYRDLIYFYMAQANYYYKNKEEAENFYLKSLGFKTSNQTEIKTAYQNLSDIYLEKPDYIKAYHYADSAAVSPKPEEQYVERSSQLERIATNLENITLQDSLIALALLSDEEKVKFAKKVMKERRNDEILSKINEERQNNIKPGAVTANRTNRNKGSNFFAYDPKSVKSGMKKFQKEYGSRPLVDNWKYASLMSSNELFAELQSEDENDVGLTQGLFDQIFEDVPKTEEELTAAYENVEESKLQVGAGFYEDFPHYPTSKIYLDSVIQSEKSTDDMKLEAYSYLMLIAEKEGQIAEKNRILGIVESKYPDFKPESPEETQVDLDSLIAKNQFFEDKYRESFSAYEDGNYQLLYDITTEVIDTIDTENSLMPKFKLLNAFAIGGLGDRASYATSLQKISQEYHDTETGEEAKRILKVLDLNGEVANEEKDGVFDTNVDFARHYVILVIKDDADVFDIRSRLEEFNATKFPNKKITLSLTRLQKAPAATDQKEEEKIENQSTTILIRSFDDKRQGLDYLDKIRTDQKEISGGNTDNINIYLISQVNYRTLLKSSDIQTYTNFFEKYY